MNTPFYLPRKLIASNSEIYTEAEILQVSPYVIILAEPGGGKTELLKSIANMLNTKVLTANVWSGYTISYKG
jgi:predicted ATP-binding protein involved in virulence